MNQPIISIVTICYNSAKTIERTIKSVLEQNYEHLDYVIIDGGSTDGTIDIVNKYKNRLGYFISEKDKGISDAFNKGIAASKGDIIAMINSDDRLMPHALQHMAEVYDGKTDVYRGNVIIVNPETKFSGRETPSMKFPLAPLTIRCAHQGTYISAKAYQQYGGYDLAFKYMMDYDLLTRFYQKGANFKYVDADVAEFQLGGVSKAGPITKRYDITHVVLNNGGSWPLAIYYWLYMFLFNLAKGTIIKCFGLNTLKRLHYKRV